MASQEANAKGLDADRPLGAMEKDRLGSREIAKKLAVAVVSAAKSSGMVIGVEGAWGSGKTSLTSALRKEVEDAHSDQVHIFAFSPWLISSPAEYAPTFMADLAKHLDSETVDDTAAPSAGSWLKGKAHRKTLSLGEKMRRYGALTSHGVGMALDLAGWFLPGMSKFAELAKKAGDTLDKVAMREAPNDLKEDIATELAKLKKQFIVVIDDLDRLEPKEAVEVVRLVRSVADFPNIAYVLCYDRAILAKAIQQAVGVDDGGSYLQKILQVTFDVPRPESFDLRSWLQEELLQLYAREAGGRLPPADTTDLQGVVGTAGSMMTTPRDVKMVLNSVRFHFPPVRNDSYYPDLCWLHLQKVLRPDLYRWIAKYLSEWAVVGVGDARPTADDLAMADELSDLVSADKVDSARSIYDLSNRIPGIDKVRDGGKGFEIFKRISQDELLVLENDRRLGSPTHYKLYFSFAAPKTALTDAEFGSIWQCADGNPEGLREALLNLAGRSRPTGGNWFEYFVDRSARQDFRKYSAAQISTMVVEVADLIDEIAASEEAKSDFDTPIVLASTGTLAYRALMALKIQDNRILHETIDRMVGNSNSIGWLLGDFLCDEMRRRGLLGSQSRLNDEPLLSEMDLETARATITRRLGEAATREAIVSYPSIVSLLFRWRDVVGSADPPSQWFAQFTQGDAMFLDILDRMRGWRASQKGITRPLTENYVGHFADWEAVKERLHRLSNDSDEQTKQKAKALLEGAVDLKDDPFANSRPERGSES